MIRGGDGSGQPGRGRHNGRMVEMSAEEFEQAVKDALDLIPDELAKLVEDVVVLAVDDPPGGKRNLLGLYEGTARTERGSGWGYGNLPDRIHIYRNPILGICSTKDQVRRQVAVTVIHEIGHHFGIDDARLRELGWG